MYMIPDASISDQDFELRVFEAEWQDRLQQKLV